jgi:hypothetical protein
LQNEKDVYNYQSSQFDRLAFDELTQLTEFEFRYLEARARATVRGVMPKIRAGTNPGNVGHGWVKATWIDAAPWDSRFDLPEVNGQSPGTGRFIPSKVDDNQELLARDPGYKDRLNLLPDSIREAYRDGSWDLFVGQFFTEFNRDRHVCKPFAIPRAWPRWIAVDYGYGAPWCVLWLARDPATRQTVVYRELYQTNVIDRVQPTKILAAMAGERCEAAYADPSMWNTQPNGTSIAQVYHAGHVPIAKANNDRKAGWQRVREALGDDDEGRPRLQIFETCLNLIRTLPVQVYDPHDSEDLDTEGEDHPEDVLRYALMGASVPAAQKTRVSFGG